MYAGRLSRDCTRQAIPPHKSRSDRDTIAGSRTRVASPGAILLPIMQFRESDVLPTGLMRGIEREWIFKDNKDREDFFERLAKLLMETVGI